jgi:glycosyltransferase involved in cell wall biosynthesis
MADKVSVYFFAGDFADVLQRFHEGRAQIYQTHNEVARLAHELLALGYQVDFHSFVTPDRRVVRPLPGFRCISLGAKDFSAKSLLSAAIAEDDSDAIVAHFPNVELLRAVASTNRRAMAVLATSYNRSGVRAWYDKYQVRLLLNSARFQLVSNHCIPATEQLAHIGVKCDKLIAWDIPHPFDPASSPPKTLAKRSRYEAVYVGSIVDGKGVFELVHAIAHLRAQNLEVHCTAVGLGDIDKMKALATTLGVSHLITFTGLIANNQAFDLMSAADLVFVPSRPEYPEGFPLTMFEAIASRTPIVCSDHPMFRQVMVDGRNASVFRAGDHRAFAAAIMRLLTRPDLYSVLSSNAPLTWNALKGPADWRTMILKWTTEGPSSAWIQEHKLMAMKRNHDRPCAQIKGGHS